MANKPKKHSKTSNNQDSVFVLKILLYLLLGMQWVWFVDALGNVVFLLPFGPALGLLFASHEHFSLDRKLDYTVLLLSGAVSFLLGVGFYFTV
ncbi:MAG: hypothetical protein U5K77_04195 [Candidatus Saccharibacteria bacterium]|nr:hypothetical protein [Candidatus Saccharibacteria bacterium]